MPQLAKESKQAVVVQTSSSRKEDGDNVLREEGEVCLLEGKMVTDNGRDKVENLSGLSKEDPIKGVKLKRQRIYDSGWCGSVHSTTPISRDRTG